jgi:RHS repeat-associated protein
VRRTEGSRRLRQAECPDSRRRPCTRKLASGGQPLRRAPHPASSRCKSLNAPGIPARVRRTRVRLKGGFEPFGSDYQQGTPAGALDNGIALRLPGQWEDGTWADATSGAGIYYNLHRWYSPGVGRYTKSDPVRWLQFATHYLYASNRPLTIVDPRGLAPCASLEKPSPGSCCGSPLAPRIQNVKTKRALYCANRDNPPITVEQKEKAGWIDVPQNGGSPTAHYKPQGNPCTDWCICDHENYHIQQFNRGELGRISLNAAECKAYSRHLKCLIDLVSEGPFLTATGFF